MIYKLKQIIMKQLTLLLFLLCTTTIFSQLAVTFEKAGELHLRGPHMDSIYHSGLNADSTKAVFWENSDEYVESFEKMLQVFGKYLKANGFVWEQPAKGFNRVYFNETGKIDYFIYSFRPEQITPEQEIRFNELLNQFIQTYQFPLQAKSKFAQCSPVTYMPVAEEKAGEE